MANDEWPILAGHERRRAQYFNFNCGFFYYVINDVRTEIAKPKNVFRQHRLLETAAAAVTERLTKYQSTTKH